MLSAVVTVLLLGVMLLILANLVFSARRERQRLAPATRTQAQFPAHPLDRHVQVVLHLQNGVVVNVEKPQAPPIITLPSTWYRRHRTIISLGFLLMLVITLGVQGGLAGGTLQNLGLGLLGLSQSNAQTNDLQTVNQAALYNQYNASSQLVRISQLDPDQYSSSQEYNTWAYSACSTASMTEVFDAYGYHLRITDVLKVESQIGMITPDLGLVDPSGIALTAAHFGFNTNWGLSWTLDQVINAANSGKPVIVSFPPDRYDGGHLLVVTGGNASYVYLADSSLWNRHSLTHDQFMQWWEGYAAVVTPRS